jgi:dTDP-glucose pyrophosphorylase
VLNLVVPIAGPQTAFNESRYGYSKNLIEVQGRPLIEHIYGKLRTLGPKSMTFIVRQDECARFHLDDVIRLLEPKANVVITDGETGGAACTVLLAIDHIARDEPLVIANGDQVIHRGLADAIHYFRFSDLDGGVVVFPSIHPRWSYVRVDKDGQVTEAAEKRPISRHATAGVYYYRRGGDFIDAAMDMIRKNAAVNEQYYVCPAFNEMILANRRVGIYQIERDLYFSLSTPNGVGSYERFLGSLPAVAHLGEG